MILVDSSVWIEYFNGAGNARTAALDNLLGSEPVAIGDLMLTEVLQGFRTDAGFDNARSLLQSLTVYELVGQQRAIAAARNYRRLRRQGVTVRKTIDTLIATFCIEEDYPLLFADRDFQPFVEHLGLIPVVTNAAG